MSLISRLRSSLPVGLWIVILVGLSVRLVLFLAGEPLLWPDSPAYLDLARMIQQGDLSRHFGARTPGYPLFILLLGQQPGLVIAAQLLLGLLSSVLTYKLCHSLTRSAFLATLAGLLFNLNMVQLVHEMSILSELLATFGVLLSVGLWEAGAKRLARGKHFQSLFLAAGLSSAYAALIRPSLAFLPFVLSFFSLVQIWQTSRRQWWLAVGMLLPAMVFLGGWSYVNYVRTGFFTLSTVGGASLFELVAPFLEFAPEEFAQLRDLLLPYRPAAIARWGIPLGIQYAARKEVERAMGLTSPEVFQLYGRLALALIKQEPEYFLRVFQISWGLFWHTSVIPGTDLFLKNSPALWNFFNNLWQHLRPIYDSLTGLFFLFVSGLLCHWLAWRRLRLEGRSLLLLTLLVISLLSAVVHSALVVGNYRYQLVTLPLNLAFVLGVLQLIWLRLRDMIRSWGFPAGRPQFEG